MSTTQDATASPDVNTINSWTQADYDLLTADFVSTMTSDQIAAMAHPEWIPTATLGSLSASQVAALQSLTTLNNAQFGLLNLTSVSASVMAGWTKDVWAGLTAAQVSLFTKAQIGSFQHASWLPATAAAGLLPSQMAQLSSLYGQFSADWFNHLQLASFTALNASRLNQISAATLSGIDNAHLTALSAAQVASMNNLGAMACAKFGVLNISALSATQIAALTRMQYEGLTQTQISSLSTTQVQALAHPEWLPSAFINNTDIAQFAALTPAQFADMKPSAIAALDSAHLAVFGGNLQSLSADVLLTIAPRLSQQQLASLTQQQTALLSLSDNTKDTLINSLSDASLKSIMSSVSAGGTSLFSFQSIEAVLKGFAASLSDGLSAAQYGDLNTYVQNIGTVCGTRSPTYSLVNCMTTGANGASVSWTSPVDGTLSRMGSLAVGTTSTQFNQLIANWFDGSNDPATSSSAHVEGRPLFVNGTPSINDIHQGGIGDCSLLGGLQAVVNVSPDFIKSMIVQNTNDTYSVRFFNKGVADWVTVDGKAPGNGANMSTSSWATILERANVAFEATYQNDVNAYSSLSGYGNNKLAEITGNTITDYKASHYTEAAWNSTVFDILKTAVLSGEAVDMGSEINTNDDTHFVKSHEMAITAFDADTSKFVITNPWGAYSATGTFEASMDQIWQGGVSEIHISNSAGANSATGQLVTAMASIAPTSAALTTSAAQPASASNALLVATQAA